MLRYLIYYLTTKDARGVPVANPDIQPTRTSLIGGWVMLISSTAALLFCLKSIRDLLQTGFSLETALREWGLLMWVGVLYIWIMSVSLLHRHYLSDLQSAQKISTQLGMEPAEMVEYAQQAGIQPRIKADGLDYYDPEDFGDPTTLLRASQSSTEPPETLLRPAAHTDLPPEQLLRAVSAQDEGIDRETPPL